MLYVRGGKIKKMNTRIKKILKETPLKTRLEVSNQMAFISLLTELGYREDKMWTNEEGDLLKKLCQSAKKHTQHQLRQIEKWEKDGKRP